MTARTNNTDIWRVLTRNGIESSLSKALSRLNILREDREIVLKPEQETAVSELVHGRDVMAVLPTGFGKSMIFTVFALARQELSTTCTRTCIIVILPLKSIIDDQIIFRNVVAELHSNGIVDLTKSIWCEIIHHNFFTALLDQIYASDI